MNFWVAGPASGKASKYMKQWTSGKIRPTIIALLLILGSTLGSVFIGEVGLQLLYRVQKGAWLWEDTAFRIGYTQPVEDRRQYSLRPLYRDEKAGLSINQLGFRETQPQEKTDNPIIVCIGDSVPFGAGVRDEETYPSYLSAALAEIGSSIGVLNAGVPSYNLRQSFDRLRKDVLTRYPPDRIVLVTVEAANDISLLSYYGSNWSSELTWAQVRWSGSWGLTLGFKRLALFHYLSPFINLSRFEKPNVSQQVASAPSYELKRKEMLENLRTVLRGELSFFKGISIPVILMPINPFYYQLSGQEKNVTLKNWKECKLFVADWDQLVKDYNDTLLKVSQEIPDAYFLDMRTVMDSQDRNALYLDYMHYTSEGNRLVAETLFAFLAKRRIFHRQVSFPLHMQGNFYGQGLSSRNGV